MAGRGDATPKLSPPDNKKCYHRIMHTFVRRHSLRSPQQEESKKISDEGLTTRLSASLPGTSSPPIVPGIPSICLGVFTFFACAGVSL